MSKIDFTLRKNTKLEDRSFLTFEFYGPNKEVTRRILPFFQNPEIEESKKVNLVKYQPLGRSSTLATYTGAESRLYNLNFRISLPVILEFQSNWKGSTFASKKLTREELLAQFIPSPGQNVTNNPYWAKKGKAQDFDVDFGDSQIEENPNGPQTQDFQNMGKEGSTTRQKTIDLLMYWINMIRSSALNNANDPTYGPPIVRLNHGILYQDIPCVCMDYKINMDDGAGYDLKTMLPRVIQVSMNLMEYRAGNFGKYDITNSVSRDNVVGWESIIGGSNTIDPIRVDIGRNLQ